MEMKSLVLHGRGYLRMRLEMAGKGTVRTRQAAGVMSLLKPRTRLDVKNHFFLITSSSSEYQ
jgi:hypothetical protein